MFVAFHAHSLPTRPRQPLRRRIPRYGIARQWSPLPVLPASPKQLISRVAAWHGLTYDDIVGASRVKVAVQARHDAMVAVRLAYPRLSLHSLGAIFQRDHSTIRYGLQKAGVPTVLRKWGSFNPPAASGR